MCDVAPPDGVARGIASEFHPQGVAFGRDASGGSISDEMKRGDAHGPAAGAGDREGECRAPGHAGGGRC